MDIREFVSYLHVAKGPDGNGEYLCRCPAHDDRQASLCVGTGEGGRILVKCQAGCDTRDVVKAMGLKMSDLYADGKPAGKPSRPAAAKPAPGPEPPPAKGAAKQKPLGKLVKAYPYTDEQGQVLFEVCRFEAEENGHRVKTFRQRHKDPGNPAAKQGGYVWNINGVRSVIYRLPEVLAAIQAGKTIYLVEGEKDADTLAAAGFAATTNPGGASKSGASKWLPEHTRLLTGAHVVILPDNDAAGINDRKQVATQLGAVCKSVKLLDLRKACPTLPTKGDITDMLEIMGKVEGLKALRTLESATEPMDLSEAQATAARDAAAALIGNVPGYCVEDGCICRWDKETPRRLCNFTAIITGIITKDDGVEQESYDLIKGWTKRGKALPELRIPAASYRGMTWLSKWGADANVVPGITALDQLRFVIDEAGLEHAARYTEYTHTGWAKDESGRWFFLYNGGAIGKENVAVKIEPGLERYCLDKGYDEKSFEDDFLEIQTMSLNWPSRIITPMTAFIFLAPLRQAMEKAEIPPSFQLFVRGNTGTFKSVITSLMLSYFGRFRYNGMPANYQSSANNIRGKAFVLKDMVLGIDDYHPVGSTAEQKRMAGIAQELSRAFGDLAERGTMKADRTLALSRPPRCLGLTSGENLPEIGTSGIARYYVVDIKKNDIREGDYMDRLQELAANGAMAHIMRKYIEWLIPQMNELPTVLKKRHREIRAGLREKPSSHKRNIEVMSYLILGYEMYARFLSETGLIPMSREEYDIVVEEAIKDILVNMEDQAEESKDTDPVRVFLEVTGEMLTSGKVSVVDLTDSGSKRKDRNVGYMDDVYYYLLSGEIYGYVKESFIRRGENFEMSKAMLLKQLKERKIVEVGNDGKAGKLKNIDGTPKRLLWIPRANIDGPKPVKEQMRMDLNQGADEQADGFKEVNDPDNPF